VEPRDEILFHKQLLKELDRARTLEEAGQTVTDLICRMFRAPNVAILWHGEILAASGSRSKQALDSRLTGVSDDLIRRCAETGKTTHRTIDDSSVVFGAAQAVAQPLSGGVLYVEGDLQQSLASLSDSIGVFLCSVGKRIQASQRSEQAASDAQKNRERLEQVQGLLKALPRLAVSLSRQELLSNFACNLAPILPHSRAFLLDQEYQIESLTDNDPPTSSVSQKLGELARLAREHPTLQQGLSESPLAELTVLGEEFLTAPVRGLEDRLGTLVLVGEAFHQPHILLMGFAGNLLGLTLGLASWHQKTVEAQTQMAHSSRLNTVGQLAAGLAHELNNPLASVVLAIDSSRRLLKNKPELAVPILEEAEVAAQRAQEVVRSLLDFSRDSSKGKKSVALADIFKEVLSVLGPQLKADAVSVEFSETPNQELYCNPGEVGQILSNLLLNGKDSILESEAERVVRVSTKSREGGLSIEVSDRGNGVPSELTEKIFEPFFTTKPIGRGSGLGLAVSRQLARAHDGDLELVSSPQGACFRLSLPLKSKL
jgi:signal transduction histidine kinase